MAVGLRATIDWFAATRPEPEAAAGLRCYAPRLTRPTPSEIRMNPTLAATRADPRPETMDAAVVTGPGRLRRARQSAEPGPGQVRIRLEGCGVCASNLSPGPGPNG